MRSSLLVVCVSATLTISFGLSIDYGGSLCPPPEEVAPCTCSVVNYKVVGRCEGISNDDTIKKVFSKNPDWMLQDVWFENCVMNFIPSSIVKTATFHKLNVSSSTLVSLFEAMPTKTPEISIYLIEVKLLRGIQWQLLSNSTINKFVTSQVDIMTFGKTFKDHMPPSVQFMWFDRTKTLSITHQAFQRLVNLEVLYLSYGSLKKISRDMFPRPWNIRSLSFINQKLASLPNDITADLPRLIVLDLSFNYFTTISDQIFKKDNVMYTLIANPIVCNCEIKWITTITQKDGRFFGGKCAEPKSFKGKSLNTLTEDDFRYCR